MVVFLNKVGGSHMGSAAEVHACIICREEKDAGIRICGQFICSACEREIVGTDVTDDRYHHYVDSMKLIWLAALS